MINICLDNSLYIIAFSFNKEKSVLDFAQYITLFKYKLSFYSVKSYAIIMGSKESNITKILKETYSNKNFKIFTLK
jgi:hypothetical protein